MAVGPLRRRVAARARRVEHRFRDPRRRPLAGLRRRPAGHSVSGWMPATMATFSWMPRRVTSCHQASNRSRSKTGCVIRNAAPAAVFLPAATTCSSSGSAYGRGHAAQAERAGPVDARSRPPARRRRPGRRRSAAIERNRCRRRSWPPGNGPASGACRWCTAGCESPGPAPQRLGDQGDAVAVPRGHVQDRLDPLGGDQRRPPPAPTSTPVAVVADPQGVDLAGEALGRVAHRCGIGALRRRNLRQQERFSARNPFCRLGGLSAHGLLPCCVKRAFAQGTDPPDGAADELFESPRGSSSGETCTNSARSAPVRSPPAAAGPCGRGSPPGSCLAPDGTRPWGKRRRTASRRRLPARATGTAPSILPLHGTSRTRIRAPSCFHCRGRCPPCGMQFVQT